MKREYIFKFLLSFLLLIPLTELCGQVLPRRKYPVLVEFNNKCESLYQSGDILNLKSSLSKFEKCFDTTVWANDLDRLDFTSRKYKLISDLLYLQGNYIKSITYVDSALLCSTKYAQVQTATLFVEKAQSLFMLRDYKYACKCLYKADSIMSNYPAKNKKTISIRSDYGTAYALSLAYCGDFKKAIEKFEQVENIIPSEMLDENRILERDRRKAKILILKAENSIDTLSDNYNEAITTYSNYFDKRKDEIVNKFNSMSSRDREGFWITQRQFIVDCYRLAKYAPDLAYDVALFNKNLLLQFSARNSKFNDCNWQDVKNGLPSKGVAIEFIQYRRDSAVYLAAIVVTKSCEKPIFVPIGSVSNILNLKLQNCITVKNALIYDTHDAKKILYEKESGLNEIIWNTKLREIINGNDNVYFSADGFIHQLAIEYLYPDLINIKFHRLTSTRSLCKGSNPVNVGDASALICGAMDFQAEITGRDSVENDSSAYLGLADKSLYFKNLNGSKIEIDSIARIRSSCKDSIFTDKSATEQIFSELSQKFKLIHISTHGYFNGYLDIPIEDLKPRMTDNILSQSVILFSGANKNLQDNSFNPDKHDDGIVSAREISDLDLSNVDLCVLAACQTGLGELNADGVYGIQRGLKNAGAGAMILSLWSVDDKATSIMMSSLYRHLLEGEDVHQAFYDARRDISKYTYTINIFSAVKMTNKRIDKNYNDPYYKDAFILLDDIK